MKTLRKGMIFRDAAANIALALFAMCSAQAFAESVPVDGVTVFGQQCDWRMVDDMGAGGGYMVYECWDNATGTWGPPVVYTPPDADSMGSLHAIHRAEPLAAILGLCKGKNEDDFSWINRSHNNCVSVFVGRPSIQNHCRLVATELTISASAGPLNPAPPTCPF